MSRHFKTTVCLIARYKLSILLIVVQCNTSDKYCSLLGSLLESYMRSEKKNMEVHK